MKKNKNKNIIPVGIFLIIFLCMIVLSAVISGAYFYFEAKSRTAEIEQYTRGYAVPLAEAFADVAGIAYKNKDLNLIKRLFWEKIQDNIINEAFFVYSDGKIVVHSDRDVEKELKGNIASDEFAYNLDLIMYPIWTRVDHAQFMDYHIYSTNEKRYFNKQFIKLIKKYVYSKIDVSGWLVTQAVIYNNKPIGCVSFLISKDRINKFLVGHYNKTVRLSIALGAVSLLLSLLISFIVFLRYRSINKKTEPLQENIGQVLAAAPAPGESTEIATGLDYKKPKEAIKVKTGAERLKGFISSGKRLIKDAIMVKDNKNSL